ncbi:MAG: hypothetical protein IE925_10095 [Rhodobacterales bacterium]|nr:hypothetical protein [Rhodobacterales bacterium]
MPDLERIVLLGFVGIFLLAIGGGGVVFAGKGEPVDRTGRTLQVLAGLIVMLAGLACAMSALASVFTATTK